MDYDHVCMISKKNVKPNLYPNEEGKIRLESTIEKIKKDGKNRDFDCILGMSGGVEVHIYYI